MRHWRPYLWGRAFVVRTDHQPLKFILDQRLATIPQHHWVSKLLGFDFTVEYKPGRMNVVADALSRRDAETATIHAVSAPSFDLLAEFRAAAANDEAMRQMHARVENGELGDQWSIMDGLVTYKNKLFVPASFPYSRKSLQQHMMTIMRVSSVLFIAFAGISMWNMPAPSFRIMFVPARHVRGTKLNI